MSIIPRLSKSDLKALLLLLQVPRGVTELQRKVGSWRPIEYLNSLGLVKITETYGIKVVSLTPKGRRLAEAIKSIVGVEVEDVLTEEEIEFLKKREKEEARLYEELTYDLVTMIGEKTYVLRPIDLRLLLTLYFNNYRMRIGHLIRLLGVRVSDRVLKQGLVRMEKEGGMSLVVLTEEGYVLTKAIVERLEKIIEVKGRSIDSYLECTHGFIVPSDTLVYMALAEGLDMKILGKIPR